MVITVVTNVQGIAEITLSVITWLVSVNEAVQLDGQTYCDNGTFFENIQQIKKDVKFQQTICYKMDRKTYTKIDVSVQFVVQLAWLFTISICWKQLLN